MKHVLRSYAMYAGGMIGVGLFGLPYVVVRAGLLPTIVLGVLVCAMALFVNLAFAGVVLRTRERHRLPGYVGVVLGRTARVISLVTSSLGLTGALLAYLITGGLFLALLVRPLVEISPTVATLVFFAVGAPLLLRGMFRVLPALQLVILILFGVTLVAIVVGTAPSFAARNIPLVGAGWNIILPYGVLLFSFWGLALVPEMVELAQRQWKNVRRALILTYATASLAYAAFAVAVAGVTGAETTEAALTGLAGAFDDGVILLGALFGVLTTFSSFLALGLTLKRTLVLDLGMRRSVGWFLSLGAPLALFGLGLKEFISVIAATGAVFLGIEGVLAVLTVWRSDPQRSRAARFRIVPLLVGSTVVLFLLGVVLEVARALASSLA